MDLKKLGINRLSVGVQSLNSKNLNFLGRLHNVNDVYNALDHATKTFDNVSVDLMYAFHGQDINLWIDELKSFLERYDLKHISLYQLTIEKGTKFFTDYKKGLIQLIDKKLLKSKQFITLQDKKIIFEKNGFIVLSKNYLIKLNSIISFLMND